MQQSVQPRITQPLVRQIMDQSTILRRSVTYGQFNYQLTHEPRNNPVTHSQMQLSVTMDNSTISSSMNNATTVSVNQLMGNTTFQHVWQEGTTEWHTDREVSLLVRVESCVKWCRWLCGSSPRCECSSHGLSLRTSPLASPRWSTTTKHHPCYSYKKFWHCS